MSDTTLLSDADLMAALGGGIDVVTVPTTDKPGPEKPGVTRINFGAMKDKPKATDGKSQYPELPDPNGEISKLAAEFLKQHGVELAAKGAKECARGQLVEAATPFHWRVNCGRAELQGTVSVRAEDGGEVLVQFKDAYKAITDIKDKAGNIVTTAEKRMSALPPDVFAKYFRQSFTIEIDSDKIPSTRLQEVVDKVGELAAELGITDAVAVSACFLPVPEFHTERYKALSPEQNMAIERSMGEKGLMTVAVTTARGRKK